MQGKKNLPIGIDNFEKIRKNDFYYVDKTGMIIDLLHSWCEVTLFTRPRRFGKSLNMSMLKAFFSPDSDKRIFDGLKISKERELCEQYMGKYPVLAFSLKSVNAESFRVAYDMVCDIVRDLAIEVDLLVKGDEWLHPGDRFKLERLLQEQIPESALYGSLRTLSDILSKHYKNEVIILIDEYDVPLAQAYERGYYDQMVILTRNLFEQALKTNDSLRFAILTGCMRISKESIFTGLNNLRFLGVTDTRWDEYFGFTDLEVRELLNYYEISDQSEVVREWYDGYRFGNVHVYCPWDVINYTDVVRLDKKAFPENYWINSSGNHVVRTLIGYIDSADVKGDIEALVNGEAVEKTVRQELTYQDMYASIENIWSVLLTTGYLTQEERISTSRFRLVIPNREVRDIFIEQILELFREDVRRDGQTQTEICDALSAQDTDAVERFLGAYLKKTISIRDTAVRRTLKENFYHGLLLAILSVKAGWSVTSNQEAGDGYSDIQVRFDNYETAMVIEVKYAEDGDMDAVCEKALKQIEDKRYMERLWEEGFAKVLTYGISFHRKRCRVMVKETGGQSHDHFPAPFYSSKP